MDEGLIRNTPDLKEACDALVAGGVAALDTEFVWRASFRPHLAIVQMAGADGVCRALDCQLGVIHRAASCPHRCDRTAADCGSGEKRRQSGP